MAVPLGIYSKSILTIINSFILSISHWLSAARPKTLPLALASIVTGSCIAYSQGSHFWSVSLLALLTATLLQILSNLANDYGDAQHGTDNEERIGPERAIQSGAITLAQMKTAMVICSLLSVASGLALIFTSLTHSADIWMFIGLGVASIFCAIAYTVGKKPYGYLGLGDLSVYVFFGLLGVGGTFYLHTQSIDSLLLLPSTASGLLAVGVLNVNNMRDIENDSAFGKTTVAVRLGLEKAKRYHMLLVSVAWLCYLGFILNNHFSLESLALVIMILGPGIKHLVAIKSASTSAEIAPLMGDIVKLALIANLLFSIAIIV